jgi:predicted nucleotidyltransferase
LTNNTKKPKKRKNKNKNKKKENENKNAINEETSTKHTENTEKESNIINENIINEKKVEEIKENEVKKEDNQEKNEIQIINDNNNMEEEEENTKIENESVESFINLSFENSSINTNKVNSIKDGIGIENKNNIFEDIKDNENSKIDENEINNINENSKEIEIEKENEEHENENNIENNNSINKTHKKKKKKKPKKKNYKLTEEELNNIYINFYNENNNFKNGTQNKIYNSINPIQSSNKNLIKDKNEQLHNLILNFEKKLYKKILSLHEIKYKSIVLLCQKIKDHFKCGLSILIYGSYSTGLELEQSDIDISVELLVNNSNGKAKNNLSQKTIPELISELNDYLSNFPEFKNVFPIVNTKIPILKMVIVQDNNIETKIDLTFNLRNIKNTVNYYINTMKRYPQIRPLTLLIKQLVKKNKLASVFDGGFSSHSIFIMVASNIRVLLKNQSLLNLGDLLNSFLHFYGKVFNYTNTTIDLMNKNDPYIIKQEYSSVPVFIDPISKINVSKSSYLHENLKKLFSDTYDKLVQGEDNLNKTFEDIFSYT